MTDDRQRTILPMPDRPWPGAVLYDAKDPAARFPAIRPVRPPQGAPNVIVALIDDVGFGASSAFGGPIATPTAERLADGGLKYTRFHTTAICSPTRAALISGRNHHTVGMGGITEMATAAPGYTSVRPNTCAPLPEILRLNGYSTAHIGKCHEVPVWESSPAGPFDRWPSPGNGFEYFYGFLGGETDQYYPTLHEGTTRVEPRTTPEQGYHLTEDLTDKAIAWLGQQTALAADKPFFLYWAPGATHAPHHVPKEWADRYQGRFDDGWDALRERTIARQKELGVIPADAELTGRHPEIPAWDDMPEELKPVLRRQMENYAGFLEHTDHHLGRLVDAVQELGLLGDTLIYLIIGDNGASAEGTVNGTYNEMISLNGMAALETPEFLMSRLDDLGGPDSNPHYAVGWAHAMCTPYQWTKQVASHWGGTRNGTIVHWPDGITAAGGGLRHQFHHVIDVAPTVLEAAGLPQPVQVHGVTQLPMQGVSMRYSFDDPDAAERHGTQYFEIFGNRGIYHQGWSAVTKHRTPWQTTGDVGIAFDDDVWELYDGHTDWTQARDLSRENPAKLHELQRLFLIEATRNNVLPLDDRSFERVLPEVSGRPTLVGDRQVLRAGMGGLVEQHVVNWRNRSWSLTALVEIPDRGADGVLLSLGGHTGGWSFYLKDGAPAFCYNLFGITRTYVRSDERVPAGEHQVRLEFAYDGGGLGKGGAVSLWVDGNRSATGRVERTEPIGFGYEYTDVGRDDQSRVSEDYAERDNSFTGAIKWIELAAGKDSHDHLIDPQTLVSYHLAKQ
ncbi:arylsulfatase [Paractinoplanes maris]|uniref:arylsulfatase n=1 Tax=Paractinoplanes maris TaxID=1734446 RepID=UPI00201FEB7C|nr:arylsulfatase [Actinoplanes maris]